MIRNGFFVFTISILATTLLQSCSDSSLYSKSISFKNNTWKVTNKPVFKIQIPDTINPYNLELTLRVSTDYAYNNLWLFFHSRTPNGEVGREPIEIKIAHPDGSWIGQKSGTIVETKVNFKNRRFPQKGWYIFTLEQGISEAQIKHVLDVSLTMKEATK